MATIKEWKHTNGYEVGETLPSVSSDDNGKVLGVSDGAWAVVSGGGGGESGLVVKLTEEDGTYTADKTAAEIYAAAQTALVFAMYDLDGTSFFYGIPLNISKNNNGYIFWYQFDDDGIFYIQLTAQNDDDYPSGGVVGQD